MLRYKLALKKCLAANRQFKIKFCQIKNRTEKAVRLRTQPGAEVLKKILSKYGKVNRSKAIIIVEKTD
jgi:hypothetical protein